MLHQSHIFKLREEETKLLKKKKTNQENPCVNGENNNKAVMPNSELSNLLANISLIHFSTFVTFSKTSAVYSVALNF